LYIETWEHIWLAGQPGMEVHHINGDPQDNSPGNLLACTPEQHRAIHAAQNRVNEFRIIALYEAGLSQPMVGKIVSCNSGTVSRVLARNGIAARKQAWNRRNDIDETAVLVRLDAGDRVGAIARDLGCPSELVNRIRKEHGRPARRPGRPYPQRGENDGDK
jgi:HNH endonuclease